jgi:hypothetical protein
MEVIGRLGGVEPMMGVYEGDVVGDETASDVQPVAGSYAAPFFAGFGCTGTPTAIF